MYVTEAEREALHAGIDTIVSAVDCAEDQEYWQALLDNLRSLRAKCDNHIMNRNVKKYVKKILKEQKQ